MVIFFIRGRRNHSRLTIQNLLCILHSRHSTKTDYVEITNELFNIMIHDAINLKSKEKNNFGFKTRLIDAARVIFKNRVIDKLVFVYSSSPHEFSISVSDTDTKLVRLPDGDIKIFNHMQFKTLKQLVKECDEWN